MSGGNYKIGYCNSCRRNVQHFRGPKSLSARFFDAGSMYILNFGPWYCSHCERRTRCLPWIRRRQPTNHRIVDHLGEAETIGNYIRSQNSLVLRKKRSGRYSSKYREGVIQRLLGHRTTIAQLKRELNVSESDLIAWVAEILESRDQRIDELIRLLRSFSGEGDRIGIGDQTIRIDESENMVEGHVERRKSSC